MKNIKSEGPIVILGGGVSGLSAALTLLENGKKVIVVEKSDSLGGAASSVKIPGGRIVPTGYHQIVGSDQKLILCLKKLGLLKKVRWKKAEVAIAYQDKRISLSSPQDILSFKRLPFFSRLKYMIFGLRCLLKRDWGSWRGRSVTELVSQWGDKSILQEIFKPLVDIKFNLNTDQADAAWIGKRLTHKEGATPFGFIPHTSWTKDMCDAFEKNIVRLGGQIIKKTAIKSININGKKIISVTTDKNQTFNVGAVISTLPPPAFIKILQNSQAPQVWINSLSKIKYISCYSLIAGLPSVPFRHYWTIALYPRRIFGGCFTISLLNDTLVTKKDQSVINLFTNITEGFYPWTIKQYQSKTIADLSKLLGKEIKPNWIVTNIIRYVSPVFTKTYQNPPQRLGDNLFLAGIYTTYPRFSSTGEAIASGKEAAETLIQKL